MSLVKSDNDLVLWTQKMSNKPQKSSKYNIAKWEVMQKDDSKLSRKMVNMNGSVKDIQEELKNDIVITMDYQQAKKTLAGEDWVKLKISQNITALEGRQKYAVDITLIKLNIQKTEKTITTKDLRNA